MAGAILAGHPRRVIGKPTDEGDHDRSGRL
jgi:hypothetical protein